MSFSSETTDSFAEMLVDFGVAVVFNGVTKSGILDKLESSRRMLQAGYQPEFDTELSMLEADYQGLVSAGLAYQQEISVDGLTLRFVNASTQKPIVILSLKAVR